MSDDLAVLYPSMSPSTPEPAAEPQTLLGERGAPQPPNDAEVVRAMYDPELTYGSHLRAPLQQLADDHSLPAEQVAELHTAASHLFAELEVPTQQATEWSELVARHAAGADDAEVREWRTETVTRLREQYGAEANLRLAQAQELVARYPGFAQMLSGTGLGSHPRVVLALVERAPRLLSKSR